MVVPLRPLPPSSSPAEPDPRGDSLPLAARLSAFVLALPALAAWTLSDRPLGPAGWAGALLVALPAGLAALSRRHGGSEWP